MSDRSRVAASRPSCRAGPWRAVVIAAMAGCTLASCGFGGRAPEPASVRGDALAVATPLAITTSEQARATLESVQSRRLQLDQRLAERERECRTRFLVNPCLEAVRRDQLQAQDGLDRLEDSARARLRQDEAIARNAAEARRLAEEAADRGSREAQRQEGVEQRQRREQEAAERARQREAEQAERAANAERSAVRSRERQAELDARAQRARQRAAEAPANRAEFESKQEQAQRRQLERLERDARRARAQAADTATAPATAPGTMPAVPSGGAPRR